MTSLVLTLSETLRYRGSIGQWSWVLHRLTGLGVVLFLTLHVIDTSWAVFYPELYVEAIAAYQSPLFTIGEFGLVFAVVYHAINGVRISVFDFRPEWWKHQEKAAWAVLGITALILVPSFAIMIKHVLDYYAESPSVLGIDRVLASQLPFAAGIAAAGVAAIFFAAITGALAGDSEQRRERGRASRVERFWWSYMRISGLIILPLVFGHLAMMHLVQGVFDLTVQGAPVVGTPFINESGTAVEFVYDRWGLAVAGLYVWRIYDMLLLGLVVLHGFNGLRYVLTDYTMDKPLLRRASLYLTFIGGAVLLVTGGGALVAGVPTESIALAEEAMCHVHPELEQCLNQESETGRVPVSADVNS